MFQHIGRVVAGNGNKGELLLAQPTLQLLLVSIRRLTTRCPRA